MATRFTYMNTVKSSWSPNLALYPCWPWAAWHCVGGGSISQSNHLFDSGLSADSPCLAGSFRQILPVWTGVSVLWIRRFTERLACSKATPHPISQTPSQGPVYAPESTNATQKASKYLQRKTPPILSPDKHIEPHPVSALVATSVPLGGNARPYSKTDICQH